MAVPRGTRTFVARRRLKTAPVKRRVVRVAGAPRQAGADLNRGFRQSEGIGRSKVKVTIGLPASVRVL